MFGLGIINKIRILSLLASRKINNLKTFVELSEKIMPDLTLQHTSDNNQKLSKYDIIKKRNQQAFQIKFSSYNINKLHGEQSIVDIGDSSGAHLLQLKEICKVQNLISINIDQGN